MDPDGVGGNDPKEPTVGGTGGRNQVPDTNADTGSGGTPSYCAPIPQGSGGAIYITRCRDWLGNGVPFGGKLEASCDSSAMGGQASVVPALRRICEASEGHFDPQVHSCLGAQLEQECEPDHEALVLDCLRATRQEYCYYELEQPDLDRFLVACPSLTAELIYSALGRHGDAKSLESCTSERPVDESCTESFLRCAYHLE